MDTKEQIKEQIQKFKSDFSKEFDIAEERMDELSKSCAMAYKETEGSVISLMRNLRDEHAKNVNEDMFICYLVGYMHHEAMHGNQTHIIIGL